jgi:acyl carrier protein
VSGQPDDGGYVAPRTSMERELCSMWIELTANDDIGITDRFLDVGGHSLLASKVVARVKESYGVRIPLRWCIEQPTVSGLAELVQKTQANQGAQVVAEAARQNGAVGSGDADGRHR